MTVRRMRLVSWVYNTTSTHSGCIIVFAFPQQQWLHDRAPVLRYPYIACLVQIVLMCLKLDRLVSLVFHSPQDTLSWFFYSVFLVYHRVISGSKWSRLTSADCCTFVLVGTERGQEKVEGLHKEARTGTVISITGCHKWHRTQGVGPEYG